MKTKEKVEQGKGAADHLMPPGYLFLLSILTFFFLIFLRKDKLLSIAYKIRIKSTSKYSIAWPECYLTFLNTLQATDTVVYTVLF